MRKVVSVMARWIRRSLVTLCLLVVLTVVLNMIRRPESFADTALFVLLWFGLSVGGALVVGFVIGLVGARHRLNRVRSGAYDLIIEPLTPENAQARRDYLARFRETAPKEIVEAMKKSLEEPEPLPDWVTLKDVPLEQHAAIRQIQAWVWKAMRPRPTVPVGGPAPPPEDMSAATSLKAISQGAGRKAPVTPSSAEKDAPGGP
jgi:hypothetical protein